jgi:hypothetical protein
MMYTTKRVSFTTEPHHRRARIGESLGFIARSIEWILNSKLIISRTPLSMIILNTCRETVLLRCNLLQLSSSNVYDNDIDLQNHDQ